MPKLDPYRKSVMTFLAASFRQETGVSAVSVLSLPYPTLISFGFLPAEPAIKLTRSPF